MVKQAQLSVLDSVLLTIGIIVGVGIFQVAPEVNKLCSSPLEVAVLWLLGGVISLAGALSYSELHAAFPQNAGEFVFLREGYGKNTARCFLWAQALVIRPGSLAALSFPFAYYTAAALGSAGLQSIELYLALCCIFFSTAVQIQGFTTVRRVQNVLTVCKSAAIAVLLLLALMKFTEAGIPRLHFASQPNLGLGLMLVLFTFGGWNEIVNLGGHLKKLFRREIFFSGRPGDCHGNIRAAEHGFDNYYRHKRQRIRQ